MIEKVKYAKRFYNKETGEHELSKRKIQVRDFGATRMILSELERGVKRAVKNFKKTENTMYKDQAEAYKDRIMWYTK